VTASETGAFIDFERLTRLQYFLIEVRSTLGHIPRPAREATIIYANLPRGLLYAFGGDRAVQVWFRDSTLHFAPYSAFRDDLELPVAAILQYQPRNPEVYVLPVEAARTQELAIHAFQRGDMEVGLAGISRSDSLAPDPLAMAFHANNAGLRAQALLVEQQLTQAESEARRALALDPNEVNSRVTLARIDLAHGRLDEADRQLDSLPTWGSEDPIGLSLRRRIAQARMGVPSGVPNQPPRR
jgi:tetratricopeptide (TPR) repeat protein